MNLAKNKNSKIRNSDNRVMNHKEDITTPINTQIRLGLSSLSSKENASTPQDQLSCTYNVSKTTYGLTKEVNNKITKEPTESGYNENRMRTDKIRINGKPITIQYSNKQSNYPSNSYKPAKEPDAPHKSFKTQLPSNFSLQDKMFSRKKNVIEPYKEQRPSPNSFLPKELSKVSFENRTSTSRETSGSEFPLINGLLVNDNEEITKLKQSYFESDKEFNITQKNKNKIQAERNLENDSEVEDSQELSVSSEDSTTMSPIRKSFKSNPDYSSCEENMDPLDSNISVSPYPALTKILRDRPLDAKNNPRKSLSKQVERPFVSPIKKFFGTVKCSPKKIPVGGDSLNSNNKNNKLTKSENIFSEFISSNSLKNNFNVKTFSINTTRIYFLKNLIKSKFQNLKDYLKASYQLLSELRQYEEAIAEKESASKGFFNKNTRSPDISSSDLYRYGNRKTDDQKFLRYVSKQEDKNLFPLLEVKLNQIFATLNDLFPEESIESPEEFFWIYNALINTKIINYTGFVIITILNILIKEKKLVTPNLNSSLNTTDVNAKETGLRVALVNKLSALEKSASIGFDTFLARLTDKLTAESASLSALNLNLQRKTREKRSTEEIDRMVEEKKSTASASSNNESSNPKNSSSPTKISNLKTTQKEGFPLVSLSNDSEILFSDLFYLRAEIARKRECPSSIELFSASIKRAGVERLPKTKYYLGKAKAMLKTGEGVMGMFRTLLEGTVEEKSEELNEVLVSNLKNWVAGKPGVFVFG